ncbi:MAG: hypothetical protein ABUL72_02390, partial [Armatimonadota bacterium]
GQNGMYRYYPGTDPGFGPSQQTGTFYFGWWAFLNDPRISEVYRFGATKLPITAAQRAQYKIGASDAELKLQCLLGSHLTFGSTFTPTDDEQKAYVGSIKAQLKFTIWRTNEVQGRSFEPIQAMHMAFWNGPTEWRDDYARQMDTFLAEGLASMKGNWLSELHWLYYCSRYLALTAEYDKSRFRPALEKIVFDVWKDTWTTTTTTESMYGWGEPDIKGYGPYLSWKVKQPRAGSKA